MSGIRERARLRATQTQQRSPAGNPAPIEFDLDWIGSRTGSSERRQVVVLAVGFEPVAAADPEELSETLERRRHFVSRIVARYGGLIERADPDLQLVCWGWPVAHEADARLAVAAALDIAGEPSQRARCGVDAGIAITQQAVFTGPGSAAGPVGEVMPSAVALQGLAGPCQVIVSETVGLLVPGFFELKPVTGLELDKGLWSVERGPHRPLLSGNAGYLAGRTAEIAALEECWSNVCRGARQTVLIEGVAGVGKSALVGRLERLIVDTGGRLVAVSCLPEQQNQPMAVVSALRRALSAAGDRATSVGHGLPVEDGRSLQQILSGVPPGPPLGVVVEDLHWADGESLSELGRLCAALPVRDGLLIALSSRPHSRKGDGARALADQVLQVAPLSKTEIEQVVGECAFASRLPDRMRRLVSEQAEGIAFYAIELARLCAEAPDENAHHRLLSGPNRINAALTGQLDALSSLKPLVQAAAVLGRVFDVRVLACVLEIDERVLSERLQMLVTIGILSPLARMLEHGYRFKHALLWSQAYGSVLKARRRALHLKMARELEWRYAVDVGVQPQVVAYHWKKAGLPREAFAWWTLAAHASAARGSEAEAIDYISEALAAKRDVPEVCSVIEEAELHELLARQQQALRGSASREAIRAYASAVELLAGSPAQPTDLDLDIAWGLASIHLVRGDIYAALMASTTLLDSARERGRDDLQALALRIHGTANLMAGRVQEAIELLSASVHILAAGPHWLSSRNKVSDPAASALAHLASAQALAGDAEAARASRMKALARTGTIKDAHTSSNILGVLALGAIHMGEPGVAAALARGSEAVASQHGHKYWAGRAALIQAWASALRRPHSGLPGVLEALEVYCGNGAGRASVIAHCLAAEIAIGAGQPQQALTLLKPFRNKGHLQGEWIYIPELMRIEAWAMHDLGGDPREIDKMLAGAAVMTSEQGCVAFAARIAKTRAEITIARSRRRRR